MPAEPRALAPWLWTHSIPFLGSEKGLIILGNWASCLLVHWFLIWVSSFCPQAEELGTPA